MLFRSTARSREEIVGLHTALADALEAQDPNAADTTLHRLEAYTLTLGRNVMETRARKSC